MLKIGSNAKIGIAASFLVAFSGCGMFDDAPTNEAMIPPSANYAPIQAPTYPPLNQPYTPNLLNDSDSRVLNIDRLNVGEANIPGMPQPRANQSQYAQPGQYGQFAPQDSRDPYAAQNYQAPGYPAQNYAQPYPVPHYPQYQSITPPNEIAPYAAMPLEAQMPQTPQPQQIQAPKPKDDEPANVIQNSPLLTPSNIIELSAVGMGVAPESTISPSQALALAKRAAVVDAYRQIGEKMYGVRLNAQDTVRDMVLINSVVKTKVEALIKNAEIIETVYKDGLCQITMELKLDGKIWHKILSSN